MDSRQDTSANRSFTRGCFTVSSRAARKAFQGWFCALSLVAVSGYYLTVAGADWSKRLFGVGVALHTALLVAIVILVSSTDGGVLVAPVIFVGPILWMIYAARIRESKIAT